MNWLRNLKIGQKLVCAFGLSLLLALLVGAVSISGMAHMNKRADVLGRSSLVGTGTTAQLISTMKEFRLLEWCHIVTTKDADRDQLEAQMKAKSAEMDSLLDAYAKRVTDPADRANFQLLKANWQAYVVLNDAVLTLSRMNDTSSSRDFMMGDSLNKFNAATNAADELATWNIQNGATLAHDAEKSYVAAKATVGALLLLACGIGASLCWYVTTSITGTLKTISLRMETLSNVGITSLEHGVTALANGDLTVEVQNTNRPLDIRSNDEIGNMARTFNLMQDRTESTVLAFRRTQESLRHIIGEVAENADRVAKTGRSLAEAAGHAGSIGNNITRAIQEVAEASDVTARSCRDMSGQSTRQQQAVEDTNASIELTAQTVNEVAESAERVTQIASTATEIAQAGSVAVEESIGRMSRMQKQVQSSADIVRALGAKSQEIETIIATIDQIASRTNLLALNAAIEAARAGEHGRGFAVVADEVRKLAEQSAYATQEITGLINSIQSEVELAVVAMNKSTDEVSTGAAQSQMASAALKQILETAEAVVQEVEPVKIAAQQMMAGIEDVKRTARTMQMVTTETEESVSHISAISGQVAASAESVSILIKQQVGSVKDVDASATILNNMAGSLQELVRQFKLIKDEKSESNRRAA